MEQQITISITIDTKFAPFFLGIVDKERNSYNDLVNNPEFCVKYPALAGVARSAVSNLSDIYDKLKEEL